MMEQHAVSFNAMGGEIQILLYTVATDGPRLIENAQQEVHAIEQKLSRFDEASELSWVNANVGKWLQVSPILFDNIVAAHHGSRISGGLFNPFVLGALKAWGYDTSDMHPVSNAPNPNLCDVPDWRDLKLDYESRRIKLQAPLDLGGIAKGWTADHIANRLSKKGRCIVNVCGDLATRGDGDSDEGWEISFGESASPQGPRRIVVGPPMGVATSGTKKRSWSVNQNAAHHIIDPRRGAPAETDIVSATVFHRSTTVAECFATVVVILGARAGLAWIDTFSDAAACVTSTTGEWFASENFKWFTAVRE